MTKSIAKYLQQCMECKLNKSKPSTIEPLTITKTPERPFDTVVIDTIGPFQKTENGYQYAITMECNLTKYLIASPTVNKDAKSVSRIIFNELIYGLVLNILTDLGTEFKNEILKELCTLLKINHSFSTAYHHETLGTVERNHRVLNEYLRAYINENKTDWDENLKNFVYCYNTTPHTSFNFKYSPFELVFNKKPTLIDLLSNNQIEPIYNIDNFALEAKYRLQKAHQQAQKYLNIAKEKNKSILNEKIKPLNIKIGDKVSCNKKRK